MCECRDKEEYTLCRDQGRLWDSKECSCSCPVALVRPCSTGMGRVIVYVLSLFSLPGFTFDYSSTCSCVPEISQEISNIVSEARVERSETSDDAQKIETVIMAVLGILLIVFFTMILGLLKTVNNLRSRVYALREDLVSATFISIK